MKRRVLVIFVVAALVAGTALGSFVVSPYVNPPSKTNGDGLNVEGYATVNVMNTAGQVIYSWQGHNSLFSWTMSDIAACLSGNTTTSYNFGSCSGWTPRIYIGWQVGNSSYGLNAKDTIALTPPGCDPKSSYGGQNCRGWVAEASFGPNSFTQSNCGNTCTISGVVTGGAGTADFDTITTTIPVSPGDSLLVTVDFTVS